MDKRIVVLGDIHFPYENKKAVAKAIAYIKEVKPTHVVQIGDLYDQYFFSRYSKNVNYTSPEKELAESFKRASKMWSEIRKVSPNTVCVQLLGNHDLRLHKRIQEKLPEVESLVREKIKSLYSFPGVKTFFDSRQEVQIEDLLFHHGYLSQLGAHVKKYNKSIVVGHSHVAGVIYTKHNNKTIFEFNTGFLGDKKALPLNYGEAKLKSWTVGIGDIYKKKGHWLPNFISFE
jgi:predicted phosphodiesterase